MGKIQFFKEMLQINEENTLSFSFPWGLVLDFSDKLAFEGIKNVFESNFEGEICSMFYI